MDRIEINGNIVINAISKKLNSTFNNEQDTYKIYRNQVVGEMEEPCFFIHQLQVTQTKVRRNIYRFRFIMDVRYHSNVDISRIYEDLDLMGIKLLDTLDSLYINEQLTKIEGNMLYCEKQNNVLHTFVNYELLGTKEELIDLMKNLDLKEDVLNG